MRYKIIILFKRIISTVFNIHEEDSAEADSSMEFIIESITTKIKNI